MKKILGLVLGLLFTLPAFATDEPLCNLYNKADGALNGYPSADLKWTTGGGERTIMMHLTEGETYTVKRVAGSSASFRIEASDTQTLTSGQTLHSIYITDDTSINTQTFTVPSGYPYVLFYIYNTQQPQITPQQAIDGFILVKGSTVPSEYIEYNPLCATCEGTVKNYTSATGTVSQNGTPTPTNPIYPTFYKQGNMILRKVGGVADTYDASTGKITRRIGVKVLSTGNGCSRFDNSMDVISCSGNDAGLTNAKTTTRYALSNALSFNSGHLSTGSLTEGEFFKGDNSAPGVLYINFGAWTDTTLADFKSWIERQYVNGNPVTIWYPLETPTEETVSPTTYCDLGIKVATKRYSDSKFSPVMTALNGAISTIKTVVTNTINQAAAVSALQTGKQTMPNASATNGTCPNYKQCLLVETSDGTPQWFQINDPFYDFVTPLLATNTAGSSRTNSTGFTRLEFLRSDGIVKVPTEWYVDFRKDFRVVGDVTILQNHRVIIFGNFGGSVSGSILNIEVSGGPQFRVFTNAGVDIDSGRFSIGDTVHFDINYTASNRNLSVTGSVDGVTKLSRTETINANLPVSSVPMQLFRDYRGDGDASITATVEIKGITVYEQGNKVYDYVPVRKNNDNTLRFYDLVALKSLIGTGTLIAGPMTENPKELQGMSWSTTWSTPNAGTLYGEARCNNVSSASATPNDSEWSEFGAYCWCHVIGLEVDNSYIPVGQRFRWKLDGPRDSASACAYSCPANCAYAISVNPRAVMLIVE